jgi:hypothetical protein
MNSSPIVINVVATVAAIAFNRLATEKKLIAATLTCSVDHIPEVFDRLRREGKDGSFAVFMFRPPNADDAVNIQFSIENGHIGLDWCLIGLTNVRDREKLEHFLAGCGYPAQLMEMNQVKYLRVEQGDLPHLCQRVIYDLYAQRPDTELHMVVEGFSWP